jgi:hypothetical protein
VSLTIIMPIQPEQSPTSHGSATATDIVDNHERHRFEIFSGAQLAGYAEYRDLPHGRAFVHTVIATQHEGVGLGSKLIEAVLEAGSDRGSQRHPSLPVRQAVHQTASLVYRPGHRSEAIWSRSTT